MVNSYVFVLFWCTMYIVSFFLGFGTLGTRGRENSIHMAQYIFSLSFWVLAPWVRDVGRIQYTLYKYIFSFFLGFGTLGTRGKENSIHIVQYIFSLSFWVLAPWVREVGRNQYTLYNIYFLFHSGFWHLGYAR